MRFRRSVPYGSHPAANTPGLLTADTTTTAAATMAAASPLLNLAGELRNRIYDFVFDDISSISTADTTIPGITLVCRQCRNETLLLWYSKHATLTSKVVHGDTIPLMDYLVSVPQNLLTSIQNLQLTYTLSHNQERWLPKPCHWIALRTCLRDLDFEPERISWFFQVGELAHRGERLEWRQCDEVEQIPELEAMMREFMCGDRKHFRPVRTVALRHTATRDGVAFFRRMY